MSANEANVTQPAPKQAATKVLAASAPRSTAILAVVSLIQLMVIVDTTVVNIALPSIKTALHFSQVDLQWVINAYTLTFAGFLLLGGRAADLLGRRVVLMTGLVLFSGASLVCGLAQSSLMLEVSRGVQGLGGAIISPAALSILLVTFPEGAARNRALAIWGAIAGGGATIGLVMGGLLTQGPGWRWVFFVNVPIGIVTLLAASRILPESHGEDRSRSYDVPGAITATLGLVLLVDAMVGTTTYGWSATRTIVELVGSALLLGIFLVIEGRFAAHPLVPLRIFRSRTLSGADTVAVLLGLALFGVFYFLSLYMQQVLGYSPLTTAVAYMPFSGLLIVTATLAPVLIGRIGARWLLSMGMLIAAAALLLLARLPDHGTYASDILPTFAILPIGLGLAFVSMTNAAVSGVDPRDSGLASALLNTSQQVGGAVGLGLLATIAASRTNSVLGSGSRPSLNHALVQGFDLAFLVAASIAAAGAVVAFLTISSSVGRVEPVGKTTSEVPSPTQGAPLSPEVAVRPASGLAACAQCSAITRHQFVTEEA
jgi:EmrB/QacA subfamily drug resistance transporter